MADSQQQAVYAWERQWRFWNRAGVPVQYLRRWVRWAERLYRVPPATLLFPTRSKGVNGNWLPSQCAPAAPWGSGAITLRPHHRNVPIALHEVSHWIDGQLLGQFSGFEGHGPQWLGIYLYLLEKARVAPRVALHESAREAGLKWVSDGRIGHKAIRQHYRGAVRRAKQEIELLLA